MPFFGPGGRPCTSRRRNHRGQRRSHCGPLWPTDATSPGAQRPEYRDSQQAEPFPVGVGVARWVGKDKELWGGVIWRHHGGTRFSDNHDVPGHDFLITKISRDKDLSGDFLPP